MIDFSEIRLSDAHILEVRIFPLSIEVDYIDWQEESHILVFSNAIACFMAGVHGKELSHGELAELGDDWRDCCGLAEDELRKYRVFSFVDVWNDRKILRIIADNVDEKVW